MTVGQNAFPHLGSNGSLASLCSIIHCNYCSLLVSLPLFLITQRRYISAMRHLCADRPRYCHPTFGANTGSCRASDDFVEHHRSHSQHLVDDGERDRPDLIGLDE